MNRPARLTYQPALDGVRAVAVLSVIAYHLDYGWARGGFLGVDVFFVLSGYLITTLLLREWSDDQHIDLIGFWGRRLRRLLPALLLVLGATAVAALWFIARTELSRLRSDALAALLYVANWRFISSGQSYFDQFSAPSPLRHLWSLAIEEQFYLVWPLLTFAVLRLRRGRYSTLGALCVTGAAISALRMAMLFDPRDPSRAYYGTDTRCQTLLVGCLLAVVVRTWRPRREHAKLAGAAAIVALLAIVWALGFVSANDSVLFHGGSLAFAVLGAMLIAGTTLVESGIVRAVLSIAPLRWIGRISYGLYLWHWPMIVWVTASRAGFGGLKLNALRVALTFAFAIASYYLVERPIRTMVRRRTWHLAAAPIAIALSAIALIGATANAKGPPSYLYGGAGEAPACAPTAAEFRHASAVNSLFGAFGVPQLSHRNVLVIGDSTACSFFPGFQAVADSGGVVVDDASVIGCGIVSDLVVGPLMPSLPSRHCHDVVRRTQDAALARGRPDFVLWMSAWEKNAIVAPNGASLEPDTQAWRAELTRRMDEAVRRLTATGARVVMLAVVPSAPGFSDITGAHQATNALDDHSTMRLDDFLAAYARRNAAHVSLVDLRSFVCPSGPPCPAVVSGVRLRVDGTHFGVQGAVLTARWLLQQIAALPR